MKSRSIALFVLPLALFVMVTSVLAQSNNTQTNFTIAPPPLGYPEYPEESTVSQTLNFTGAIIRGKDLSVNGFLLGWIPRYGGDWGAIDCLVSMFVMSGDIDMGSGSQSLTFVGFDLAPAIELPIINTEPFKLVLFGGFDMLLSRASFSTTDPYSSGNTMKWYFDTVQYGPLAGIQAHIALAESLLLSPFVMIKSMRGSVDVTTDPAYVGFQTSYDIPAFTVMTYGFDIVEKTTGLTLSGLLQLTGSTSETQSVKSYVFGVSIKL